MSKQEGHEEEFGSGCCGEEREEGFGPGCCEGDPRAHHHRPHFPWGHAWRHAERFMPPHLWGLAQDCGCGAGPWGPGFPFRRRFPTREERIAWLEQYLKELQAEAKAVEERIAELKAAK